MSVRNAAAWYSMLVYMVFDTFFLIRPVVLAVLRGPIFWVPLVLSVLQYSSMWCPKYCACREYEQDED